MAGTSYVQLCFGINQKHYANGSMLQVAALILENTFTSILDMAGIMLPFLRWFIGGSSSKGPKLLNCVVRSPWSTHDIVGEVSFWWFKLTSMFHALVAFTIFLLLLFSFGALGCRFHTFTGHWMPCINLYFLHGPVFEVYTKFQPRFICYTI